MVGGVRDIKGEVKAMKGRIEILRPPVFSRSTPAYVLFDEVAEDQGDTTFPDLLGR
jgi:hypothetical protein